MLAQLNELGYLPLPAEAASALFQVVSQRYLKTQSWSVFYGASLGLLPRSSRIERLIERVGLGWGALIGAAIMLSGGRSGPVARVADDGQPAM